MPLDFPSGPAINDTWTASNGATYTWDGQKWTVSGSGTGPYLPLSGGTMTGGDITLFRDPTQPLHASPRRYVDNAINLAGNYLGTWSVAANSPNISAGGAISNANYVATTVNPATPEVVPVGVPGIAGLTVGNGDRIIWAAGPNVWQILRNAGVTLAAADARYVALGGSTMTGALTLAANPVADLQATTRQYVDNEIASHVGGGVTAIYYAARSTTTAAVDPGSGHVAFNTAAQGTATQLYISGTSSQSVDWSLYWRGLSAGTRIVVQRQTDSSIVCRFTLNSTAVDNGGWLTLPVTPYGTPAGFPVANNLAMIVAVVTVGGGQFVSIDGSNAMTGPLTLPGAPTATLHAATKGYVDTASTAANNTGRNRLHNPRFSVNQRTYVSGTALAAGAYAHDRWKAGASGCTYTFTQSQPGTTITITAGSLQQIVEAMSVEGGTYTLSWTGTAQGRVNAGAYAASPVTTAGLAVNTAITIEFNAGTLAGVQLELGSVATPLEKPDPQVDLANCRRFFEAGAFVYQAYQNAGVGVIQWLTYTVPKRATPTTIAFLGQAYTNGSAVASYSANANGTGIQWIATAQGTTAVLASYTASADL